MSQAGETITLNPAQREAVEHLHGPALVIAGAGTGKTRVITERVLYLLESIPDLGGDNILALTYTRKAAGEMIGRIRRRGGRRAADVRVCTFHEFCLDLLRRHSETLRLLDSIDYWIFLRQRLPQLGLDLYRKRSEPGRFLSDFQQFFSRCQDELVSPADYDRYVQGLAAEMERDAPQLNEDERTERADELARQQEIARVYARAEQLLNEADCTTFGGLLISAVRLLEGNEQLRAQVQDTLRYIVVDEFQDTNIAQIRLLELLAARHRNLMAVGDDDQAIYRFRGASYGAFNRFRDLFPDMKRISLNQNYRSTARILDVAGQLIAQNGPARFDPNKRLLPSSAGGDRVQLAEVEDVAAEAAHVRGEIGREHGSAGAYRGLAVLYRAHAHREALVGELARAGVPFVIRGLSILANPLIRDVFAYLRVLGDPADSISFARLVSIPAWKTTPEDLLSLIDLARREKCSLLEATEKLHGDVLRKRTRLGDLLDLISEQRKRSREADMLSLFDGLTDTLGIQFLPGDPDRLYLETLREFVREWQEEKSSTKRLREFLEYFDYFQEAGGTISLPEETGDRDAVQLMTVHASKGLEFDTVFVLRLNQSDFPTRLRKPLFEFPQALMKEALPPGRDILTQEERRLCYVAFTRARRRLHLSTLTGKRKKQSIFLEDVLRDPRTAQQIRQHEPQPAPQPESAPDDQAASRLFDRGENSRVYSRIAAWADGPAGDTPPQPLTLSHSAIDTYASCPLKYKLANLWQLQGRTNPAMVFGLILHRCLAEYFRERDARGSVPDDEVRHIYELQWEATGWPFRDEYQREDYYTGGWQQFQTFHLQQKQKPDAHLESEKTFEWKFDPNLILTGRIDQLNRATGPAVEIVEYKTGEPRKPRSIEKSRQLALYALAATHSEHLDVETLTLYNLTANEAHSFSPDEKDLNNTLDELRDISSRIRAREFPARRNFFCRTCDYHSICPAQEQASAVHAVDAE